MSDQEHIITIDSFDGIGQYKCIRIPFDRNMIIKKVYLQIKLNAVPEGFRWKKYWTTNFIKNFRFKLDGRNILETRKEWFQMSSLILETPEFDIDDVFDYNDHERTIKSSQSVETSIEICKELEIDLYRAFFLSPSLYIELSSLDDILERVPDSNINLDMTYDNIINLINVCDVKCVYRNDSNMMRNESVTQHFYYSDIETAIINHSNNRTVLSVRNDGISHVAYMWLRNEDDTEIPFQIIKHIHVLFNNTERHNFTGNESRFYIRNLLSDKTKESIASENMYFLPYSSGMKNAEGITHGANFSRLDNYNIVIEWEADAPPNIKFTLCHKTLNWIRSEGTSMGVLYHHDRMSISGNGVDTIVRHQPQLIQQQQLIQQSQSIQQQQPQIQEKEYLDEPFIVEHINIKKDATCLITFDIIIADTMIDQCNRCKQIYLTTSMDKWRQNMDSHNKCPHCSYPYTYDNFIRGLAIIE